MANYNGLTRNQWPGTWSPSSNHPIVLDTEIRGGLRYVSGDSGDKVTDITGQRLQDGMIVYVENQHTAGTKTFEAGKYYQYAVQSGESRDSSTGVLPNDSDNWSLLNLVAGATNIDSDVRSKFSAAGDLSYNSSTGVFSFDVEQVYTKTNFDSDLGAALSGGVGIAYDSATDTISIDSSELEANFKQDIRGYFTANNSLNYNSTTGDFRLPQPLDSAANPTFTNITANGDVTFDSSGAILFDKSDQALEFGDNYKATFGDNDDLQIFHATNGTGIIQNAGSGQLQIRSNTIRLLNQATDEDFAFFRDDGAVELYYDNTKRFETTDSGVTVTGSIRGDSATIPLITADSAIITDISGNTLNFGTLNGIYEGFDSDLARTTSRQTIRTYLNAVDAGGDGSFAYDSALGKFTYTGPSSTEVRAHLSASNSLSYNSSTGDFRLPQPLDSAANPTFNQLRGPASFIIDPAAIGDNTGTVRILGNLQVEGTQTIINSTTVSLNDKNIVIADSAADSSALDGGGITWGGSSIVDTPTFNYSHANARLVSNREINAPLFSGSGASLTNLPAASLTGTIDSARIPTLLIADIGNITSIDHDALTNFVANEHIDHTAVSITAGFGLKGGGTIASTRDLAIDSSELTSYYRPLIRGYVSGGTGITYNSSTGEITTTDNEIVHDNLSGFVADEHVAHSGVSITAGFGLKGGGTIASTRDLAIDSAELLTYYEPIIRHDNLSGFVANEHIDHTAVSITAGTGLKGGGTIASTRDLAIDSAELLTYYEPIIRHDNLSGFVADEHVAHTGVSIVAGKGLTGGGNIASSRTIDIDSANIRGMFSAGGDLSYNSGTGEFSFDVESVYTANNFDSDYFFAKDSANTAVERNQHDSDTKNFAVTVAAKVNHVYSGGSGQAYYIDGTESPIVNLKIGRTYRFTLSSSDMSSHPFRFYYDAAKSTQYTTGVTTTATYAEIAITEATPSVLHYQCSAHGYMGHALQIGTRNLTGFTTSDLTEGTNLYYTDGRFDTRFGAKTTDNLSEGSSNLYYTDARARAVSLDSAEAQAMIDSNINNDITFGGDVNFDSAGAILFDKSDQSFKFGDNKRIRLGASNDLQIYHDGIGSNIINTTGNLIIADTSGDVKIQGKYGEQSIVANNDGSVELYYDNTKKVETTAYGATVTGTVNADSATVTGFINLDSSGNSGRTKLGQATTFGGNILSITNSSGYLQVGTANSSFAHFMTDRDQFYFNKKVFFAGDISRYGDNDWNLKRNDVTKLTLTDSGVNVTGEISADSAKFDKLTAAGLVFPTSDGLNNYVIRTDGSGNLSFASVTALSGNIDSAAVIQLVDSAYVQARTAAGTDSAATQAMIDSSISFQVDSAYVQLRQSGGAITVQEEGSSLSTSATTLNFVGSNVTATGSGATKTITITGGSGATGFVNNVGTSSFVGDSSTKSFTLTQTPADSDDAFVFINGLLQQTNTYAISGQTLTLDSAPVTGDEIEVRTHLLQSAQLTLRDHKSYIYTLGTNTTTLSGNDSSGTSLTYDVGKVDVFVNGSRLVNGKDFTATTGTSIVFDSAFSAGNIVEVVSHAKATTTDLNGILSIDSDLTTTSANQIVYTYPAANHRTLKFTAQLEHDASSSYHAEEVLLTHNGTNVAMTTYAQVLLDSNLGTFDADINSGNVRVKFTPTKTNTSIKLRAIRTPA